MKVGDAKRLDKLIWKAKVSLSKSVLGTELDSLVSVAEERTLNKLLSIRDKTNHSLPNTMAC